MLLADYQDAFAQALLAEDPRSAPPQLARLVAQPGFAVYRNTVLKGCIDALHANFPAVARLVGDEWFRAAAAVYARRELPTTPTLLTHGQTFADFLARFEPAAELPYLAAVARVDRLWSEAHVAADDAVLDPAALASLAPADMDRVTLPPHAAARWTWCDEHPIYTLWSRNRDPAAAFDGQFDWRGEGILLTRPQGAVKHQMLSRAGSAFLSACAEGLSIGRAVAAAIEVDATTDLAALVNQFLQAGAFAAVQALAFEDA
jgi:Putative DNA-binding domain